MLTAALPIVKNESKVNSNAGNEANIPKDISLIERESDILVEVVMLEEAVLKNDCLKPSKAPNVIPKIPIKINGVNLQTVAIQDIPLAALVEKVLIIIKITIIAYATNTII
jgi:hypothetical protein